MCLGNESAESYLIFLRGMDKAGTDAGEKGLRELFTRLAQELNLRVALPRSSLPCSSDRSFRCWGWDFGSGELDTSSQAIQNAASTCFPQDAEFGLLGFSNGGYLLSKLYRNCQLHRHLPQTKFAIVVGATALRKPIRDIVQDLRDCGRVRIISGRKDSLNADLTGSYAQLLRSRGGDVEEIFWDGGHTLPEKELRLVLKQLLQD